MKKDIKFYLYLSKVKVDMLWEQLSQEDVEKISAELKINIGIFSGGLKSEEKDENIYAKLNVVLNYLEHKKIIGSVENPLQFFKGTLPMTWNELDFEFHPDHNGQIVLFSGFNNKVIGLVGSAAHIIGMHKLSPITGVYIQPSFWHKMAEEINSPEEHELERELHYIEKEIMFGASIHNKYKQNVEFVAKTFISKEGFLFGSPIYISEAQYL